MYPSSPQSFQPAYKFVYATLRLVIDTTGMSRTGEMRKRAPNLGITLMTTQLVSSIVKPEYFSEIYASSSSLTFSL